MTVWYSKNASIVKLPGKISAAVAQVRGNYVLCRTDNNNYPWPKLEQWVHDWQGYHKIRLADVMARSYVKAPGQPQQQKTMSKSHQLGGDSDDEPIIDIPEVDKFERVVYTVDLRFNLIYDISTGGIVTPNSLPSAAMDEWFFDEPIEMSPRQERIVLESCNIENDWDKMYKNLNGVGVKVPSELKCPLRFGGNGRVWQLKSGKDLNDKDLLVDITMEQVLSRL